MVAACSPTREPGALGERAALSLPPELRAVVSAEKQSPERAAIVSPGHQPTVAQANLLRLNLSAAVNRALVANRGVLASADDVEGAKFALVAAESDFELKIVPATNVGFGGGTGKRNEPNYGVGIGLEQKTIYGAEIKVTPGIGRESTQYRSGIDSKITQPLLRGTDTDYVQSGVRGAEFALRTTRRAEELKRIDMVLVTIAAMYDIVRFRELVRLFEASVDRLRGHAAAAEAMSNARIGSAVDLPRSRLQLKQGEDQLARARQGLSDALDQLLQVLAYPQGMRLDIEAPLSFDIFKVEERVAVDIALAERVELVQSADTLREAERGVRNADHNTLPVFNIVGNYGRFGLADNFGDSTDIRRSSFNVGLQSTTDLFRTKEKAEAQQARLRLRSAKRSQDQIREDIVQQVRREVRGLARSGESVEIQRQRITEADGQLAVARVRFQFGLASNFDVIDAEIQLLGAQTALLSSVIDTIIGTWRVKAAMGTLFERPRS